MTTGNHFKVAAVLILTGWCLGMSVSAQTTALNYQRRLTDGGNPANGNFQMQFMLFDSSTGRPQV